MSAERLRAAAELLRGRSDAATPGPWTAPEFYEGVRGAGDRNWVADTSASQSGHDDAAFISTMNPTVALALADWLEADATLLRPGESIEDDQTLRHAGRVADAILAGGAS